jgi:putative ABC transport system ATP-binding protein
MLRLIDVVKHYELGDETIRAVDGVSLTLEPGEFVALYGPSGSGKSTLLNLIAGFQTPDRGTILVNDRDLATLSEREHAEYLRLTVGIVTQRPELLPASSARDNAALKLVREYGRRAGDVIEPLLAELGLSDRANQPARKLSHGERQRVLIAQALSTEPAFILADEPTGSLDASRSRDVLKLLRRICRKRGAAVLLVTHDQQAIPFADCAHELRDGHLQEYHPDDLLAAAAAAAAEE